MCENGTYRIVSGSFETTQRSSSTERRPLPYPPAFGNAFPTIITFVGTLDAIVVNENGEQFRLMMSDLAHEVMTPTSFSSTAPIHAFFVDSEGRVRDRASLVGRVNIDRTTGEAVHSIVDEGTCHQTATLLGNPGVTVFGPFFVLPFPTTVIMRYPAAEPGTAISPFLGRVAGKGAAGRRALRGPCTPSRGTVTVDRKVDGGPIS